MVSRIGHRHGIFDLATPAGEVRAERIVLAAIAARAIRTFPAPGRLNVVRTGAALRMISPDGFPICACSATHRGAFPATCHSGVTLAAEHAFLLPPLPVGSSL